MKFVAFFRNTNLGRPKAPTRTQLEGAFADAGAAEPVSFLTNGTLIYGAPSRTAAERILARACRTMRLSCGLTEPGFLRSTRQLAALAALDPFTAVDRAAVYECCVTFLDIPSGRLPSAPFASPRGDVEVLRVSGGAALSLSRLMSTSKSPGSPNAYLERLLGARATTRAWNTVIRLLHKYG